jgi:hypothetical protein
MEKKCYIAGKIGKLPKEEYEFNFAVASIEVASIDMIPISPIELPHNHGKTWNEYMKEDLIAMLQCQSVYALRNWRQSPGATIEVETAKSVGIEIIYQK